MQKDLSAAKLNYMDLTHLIQNKNARKAIKIEKYRCPTIAQLPLLFHNSEFRILNSKIRSTN